MPSYILKRLLAMIPTLFGVVTLSFLVTQFVPGGPIEQIMLELQGGGAQSEAAATGPGSYDASSGISPQQIDALRQQYGFDKPLGQRYLEMLAKYARLDLGMSHFHQERVRDLLLSRLPVSLSLALWTVLIAYLVSIPLGIAKAVHAGSRFDLATSLVVIVGYSIPGFVMGILLLLLFGGGVLPPLFPLRGLTSDDWETLSLAGKLLDYLWHMALPVASMAVGSFAIATMLTKNTFMDEFRRQYVLTARAKGLSSNAVLYRHVLRNAMLPLVTGFSNVFVALLFSGSLLIETMFSLNGVGLLSFEAIMRRDYPVVLGSIYLFTIVGLLIKLAVDIGYTFIDPRIKFDALEG
ncbi:ABC transporter permease subunit [Corticibacter populi]|uniref:ABC transporter permease subunit n=1 Tax=Corticibacter populi TaxID=1550736 RepID=A0A3M6QS30_9BURK|nr:ABC transporter permease subunit [Corticibacter populi]RMX05850.1 ABC transporter permease subunit [Corticibacter populi]RZS30833.1 microcin C transport system permease protein [Corticibacter populi]